MDENIISRFKEFLNDKEISAAELAEKIGVQRSNISHILSGRNKPSLDFVVKLLEKYPDLNIYWLLNNKGSKYREKNTGPTPLINPAEISTRTLNIAEPISEKHDSNSSRKVKYITIFYNDGTFENYTPN